MGRLRPPHRCPHHAAHWSHADAEGVRDLQRVHDVQVVRPGFSEDLPRMAGGIGADGAVLPIRGRVLVVVPLQG